MTAILTPAEVKSFQNKILDFAKKNYREFSWRNTIDPYEILVSEVMLQQTQTERVVPKYAEWLASFPTVQALAQASLTEVLTHWSGLGYNRRARFLQQAAQMVVEKYNGVFPKDSERIDELPGVGEYTAKAVACFAFGAPEVFIETNIRTVFIHEFFQTDGTVDDKEIIPLIAQTVYKKDVRLWYYALMDYGTRIKKEITNPNRQSKSYARQSKFSGSLRQARGAILRQLTKNSSQTLEQISAAENIEMERLQKAAEKLADEGLVVKSRRRYSIKN